MPNITVLDGNGNPKIVNTLPAVGSGLSSASLPVTIASDDILMTEIAASLSAIPASSTPLAGSTSATATVGPFTPQLGRDIWITLSGTWSGTAQVLRSIDGGTTKLPLTVGGQSWASYTANAQEPFGAENVSGATYYLAITITSGTINYRVSQ